MCKKYKINCACLFDFQIKIDPTLPQIGDPAFKIVPKIKKIIPEIMPETEETFSDAPSMQISRVAVKAPPFWRSDPLLWFKQMESQFIMAGVTQDSTKFHTIVASIESNILEKVHDIIINPPTTNMYDALKAKLISAFSDSEEKRLRKLLTDVDLADKKPSELLSQMRSLAQGKISDDILKQLWMQRLPPQMKAILSVSEDRLEKLTAMADKISDCTDSEINVVSSSSESRPSRLDTIERKLEILCNQMEKIGRSRSQSQPRGKLNRSKSSSQKDKPLCWYHFKFGERAKKCVSPCNFNQPRQEN